ncbi:hypothetical protein FN846DRAFT_259618 [Sphaerosporella brunnea]|uniref:Uncharacterized protein n=1 Tax=Sphaerosporella brunnea TaxID=1250544 RepID=A0A5J5F795_9PEZI|nr:hypothetical protein FN846DRAFT_259618 [Sphaerosporella brunnea]
MPAPHTTPSTASVATAAPSPTTTPRTTRSGRAIQQPSQLQHVIGIGKGSPATYSASAVQNPVYGAVEGGRSSPAANGMWGEQRTNPTPANLLADVSTGTTYNISPTHEMAHPQRRMNEHEVAMMAGNRSMGAPTPTSTSSYGGGGKDEGGYGSTLGARRGSEYEGTDDSFGGGMMGAGGLDDAGLQGHVSPDYGLDGEDYNGGHDGHEAGEDAGERDGPEGSETRDQFKMMSEEGEAHEGHEQSGTWTETKTKVTQVFLK